MQRCVMSQGRAALAERGVRGKDSVSFTNDRSQATEAQTAATKKGSVIISPGNDGVNYLLLFSVHRPGCS